MDLDHGNGSSKYSRTELNTKETDGIGSNERSGKHQGLVVRNQSRNNRQSIVGNRSNKDSTRHLELDDEAGSSEHSSEVSGSFKNLRRYIELDAETGSSNQSDTHSEVARIENNHFEINPEFIWGNNHNFEALSDGSKQSEVIQGVKDWTEGDKLISDEKQSSTSSSSSSSSSSSAEDRFQAVIKQSKTRPDPKPEENATQSLPDKHYVSGNFSNKLEEKGQTEGDELISAEKGSLTSSSSSSSCSSTDDRLSKTGSDPKPEENAIQSLSNEHHVSGNNSNKLEECKNGDSSLTLTSQVSSVTHEPTLMQSPPVQVMDRVGDLEPDYFKLPSAVFARSKSIAPADWSLPSNESLFSIRIENSFSRDHIPSLKSGEPFISGEFVQLSPAEDTDIKQVEPDKSEATSVSEDTVEDKSVPSVEEPVVKKPGRPMISWNSATIAHHSVDRAPTAHSISFPVKNKKKKKCGWPSCYCSNCWLAVCYNWNCTIWPDGKKISSKDKIQQQQEKKQHIMMASSSVPSKSACCCSYFSSC